MRGRADLRLLAPAAAAWAIASVSVVLPDVGVPTWLAPAALWTVAALTASVLIACTCTRQRPRTRPRTRRRRARDRPRPVALMAAVLLSASAAALVAQAATIGLAGRETSALTEVARSGAEVDVVVDLTGAPAPMAGGFGAHWESGPVDRVRFDAALVSVDGRDAARVPVTVTGEHVDGLVFGGRAAFRARADAQPAFESAAFRLRATGEFTASAPAGALDAAAGLRAGFGAAAARLGGDGGALVPGLAIGDTSAVGIELDADMKAASLTHLTAVSGANCAIVTALAFAVAGACGAPRLVRVLVALAALAGFVALVTPESSVVRAAAMAVVVLIATAWGRPGGGIAALSLAVIVLLVADPWYARDYGFALSVCATAGLLLLAGPLGARLSRVMPHAVATALAVPLAAQLACQPVLILLDPAIAGYGVVANLLAAPAAPIATMVGLSGCLVLPWLPSVGFAALQVAAVPAEWIALVAHGVAALPAARVPWLPGAAGAVLLAAGTGAGLWLALAGRRPRWLTVAIAAMLLVALAVPIGVAVGGPLLRRAGIPADWVVGACDIGQGDAVLLRVRDAVALIDTGPDEAALERCLTLTGVDHVDLLVLTHWDADHVAATGVLAGRVGAVIHGPLDAERSARALAPLVAGGADTHEVTAGMRGALGDAAWTVLWPPPRHAPGNDASVVLDVRTPDYRGVFLGDLGEQAQIELMRTADPGMVDLVKVAHHGSADQSAALYDRLAATVGVIGVGADNGYGHPTSRLLDVLADDGTAIVRTDLSGTALLSADRGAFRLWSERVAGDAPPQREKPGAWPGSSHRSDAAGSGGGALLHRAGNQFAEGQHEAARGADTAGGRDLAATERGPPAIDDSDEPERHLVERDAERGRVERQDRRLRCAPHRRVLQQLGRGEGGGHSLGRRGRGLGGRLCKQGHDSSDQRAGGGAGVAI